MKKKYLLLALSLLSCHSVLWAQNPIIRDQFSADPSARVFNGKVYVYPSHDIPAPEDYPRKDWFSMADYHVFSSENLLDWTDHGVIVSQGKVSWVRDKSYSMWAPDCIERNGKYYFYFPAAVRDTTIGFGSMIGVAISDNPYGPFKPEDKPIAGVFGIDPNIFIDDDGQAYITWAGRGLQIAKLKPNMLELDGQPIMVSDLPQKGMKEGPYMFKRNGIYYYTFPWVQDKTETLAYATAKNPMGPFEYKGLIMDEWANACWTNHHSIIEYKGQWYLFYHHNDYSPNFDKNRSVCVDSLFFNPDGSIVKVKPTLRGVGVDKASRILQIDRYSRLNSGAAIAYLTENPFDGWKTVLPKGSSVQYNTVDFGQAAYRQMRIRLTTATGGTIKVFADKVSQKPVAQLTVPAMATWGILTVPVLSSPTGMHNIVVQSTNGTMEVDWLTFEALTPLLKGGFETGQYRNFFVEMGYSEQAVQSKLAQVYSDVFEGPDKCYFEVGDSLAYISDIKNHDVRTEGMSYGLMIAVQLDKKEVFDRLWRWSKKYMQHQDGPMKGYFAWSLKTDGSRIAQGPASDGELYFVTALIFASNRWGNATGINYLAEAQYILNCSESKIPGSDVTPLIDRETKLITFVPTKGGNRYTDPSYHLPAFYEVWARWAGDGRSAYWRACAQASREYLHKSINHITGLNPDTNNYDGSMMSRFGAPNATFRFDSWRVPMNIALDFSWACADREWQIEYGNKFQDFLYAQGVRTFADQFNTDGTKPAWILPAGGKTALRHGVGLVATSAAVSLVCTHPESLEFVRQLWDQKHVPDTDGYFDAYYDGLLRLFAFMHLSGQYRVIFPEH